MRIQAIDVGGTGVKSALFDVNGAADPEMVGDVRLLGAPEWGRFEEWLVPHVSPGIAHLVVACAGFVDPTTGVNRLCRVAGWKDRPVRDNLARLVKRAKVWVLNDVEAHLAAHTTLYPHPQLVLALGSCVGMALSDEDGRTVRTRRGWNLEFGALRFPTRSKCDETWWLLGEQGLQALRTEMGDQAGVRHFGHRLGSWLACLSSVFVPRTIVLSGGTAEHCWSGFRDTMLSEFDSTAPDWVRAESPAIVRSPFGRQAALWGMARVAAAGHFP